jgi:hypothetical protein
MSIHVIFHRRKREKQKKSYYLPVMCVTEAPRKFQNEMNLGNLPSVVVEHKRKAVMQFKMK